MRETEHPYVAASAAIDLWLRNEDPSPALKDVPDHLIDLVKYSVKCQCQTISYWAKQQRKGRQVPRKLADQVGQYLRARG